MKQNKSWKKAYLKLPSSKSFAQSHPEKIALYGVKASAKKHIVKSHSRKLTKKNFALFQRVLYSMSLLTPVELENVFPIGKKYTANRYGMKNYFTTRDALNNINTDKPIGEGIIELLANYYNEDIIQFLSKYCEVTDNMLCILSRPTIAERFAKASGTDVEAAVNKIKKYI